MRFFLSPYDLLYHVCVFCMTKHSLNDVVKWLSPYAYCGRRLLRKARWCTGNVWNTDLDWTFPASIYLFFPFLSHATVNFFGCLGQKYIQFVPSERMKSIYAVQCRILFQKLWSVNYTQCKRWRCAEALGRHSEWRQKLPKWAYRNSLFQSQTFRVYFQFYYYN